MQIKREPLETMDCLILSSLLFGLNLATEFHDFSRSVCHVQSPDFMSQLNWVESYGSIQLVLSVDLNTFSPIPHSLFLLII